MIHTPTQLIFPRDQIPIGSISSCCTHDYNEPTNSCHILKWFWNDSEMIHTATEAILSRDQMPLGSILSCCSCFVPEFCSRNITQRCARVFVNKIPCYIVSHMKGYLKALECLLTKYLATLYITWNDIWKLLLFCCSSFVKNDDDYDYDDDI